MITKDIYKIEYRFHYVDRPEGNIKDFIYTTEKLSKSELVGIIKNHLDETDSSKVFNSIVDIIFFSNRYIELDMIDEIKKQVETCSQEELEKQMYNYLEKNSELITKDSDKLDDIKKNTRIML